MAQVDFSRPYGEVYGEASHRYEQDGKRFDAQGDEVVEPDQDTPSAIDVDAAQADPPKRKYTRRAAPAAEPSPVDSELAAQMQG